MERIGLADLGSEVRTGARDSGSGDGKCEYRTWEIMVGPGGYGSELKEANERGRKELKRLVEAAT